MGMTWLEAHIQRLWWPMAGTRRSKDRSRTGRGVGGGLTCAQAPGDRLVGVSGKVAAVKMKSKGSSLNTQH